MSFFADSKVSDQAVYYVKAYIKRIFPCDLNLSDNKPCFSCNIAITNSFVLHTCEISVHIHQPLSKTFFVFFECNTTSDWLKHMA